MARYEVSSGFFSQFVRNILTINMSIEVCISASSMVYVVCTILTKEAGFDNDSEII